MKPKDIQKAIAEGAIKIYEKDGKMMIKDIPTTQICIAGDYK